MTSPPPANCVSLACPADQVIWTCGTNAVASYTVTATNACGGAANLLCLPPPGTVLPAGTNLVQCTAYDGLGACANCTFKIIVRRDTNAPVLLGPGPITEYVCGGGLSGPVNFTVLATDDSGAALTVICTNQFGLPVASGQAFPLGTNTVTCFTADACGRTTQCSFTVTVVNQLVPFNFSAGRRNSGQGWSFLDVFQGWVREPATPGACLNAAFPTPPVPWKHFDDSRSDQWFAQDFPSLPAGLASARLDAVMRPYPSLYFGVFFQGQPTAEDDVIKLRHLTCAPGGGFAWGQEIRQLPGSGGVWSLDPLWRTISLDLANLPPGFPGNTNNLLPLLNTPGQRRLDVLVQDDTTVDYLQLSGTFCPSEPFIGGVPAVLGPGVSLLRVPDAAAALRLAAPATGEVTLATFPLNGASGLALRCAGWGTGDLNNDGATDPVDAFSTVRAPGVCFNGRCLDYAVTFTPDGQVEVTFTPDGHPGTNAKVVMSFRDAAGQPITSVTNSLSLAFTKIKYEYKARPMTNGGCFDLWAGPGLIVHQPMPASGANEWLLLSLQAGCGFVLSNGPSGQTGAAVDMFLQIDDALAVVPPRPVLKEFQLTTRGLDGATLATLDPVLPALVNPRAAPLTTGRRQYKPLMTRKRIDKSTPLLLPHPGGWNLTGLAATSSVSLRFAGLISSLVGPCIRVNHDEMTASMVSQYRGSIAGVPDQVLDTCAVRLIHNSPTGGDGLRLEPDFSALGASTFRVQIYDAENVLLHDRPGQTGDAGSATAWPFSWGRLGGTVRSRLFGWETPVRYALGTQLFTNVATVLILAEEGPTAPLINGLSGLDLHTVGIRLLDFGSVQTDIGAQREIRVVTDGAAPRVTWSPVGGQLEVSTNLVQWTGTTNASGQPLNGPAPARYFRVRE